MYHRPDYRREILSRVRVEQSRVKQNKITVITVEWF